MTFPVPQLTTLVLLAHSLLGCCWHHAHACADECCPTPAPTAAACLCNEHQHPHCQPDPEDGGQHPDHGPFPHQHHDADHACQASRCTFLRTEVSPRLVQAELASLLPLDSWRTIETPLPPLFRLEVDEPATLSAPPLRAHLLFGVLLI